MARGSPTFISMLYKRPLRLLPNGDYEVPLTRNKVAVISSEDYDVVSKHNWSCNKRGYAETRFNNKLVLLHRLIMTPQKEDIIDHKDGDKLNNRRENLRVTNKSGNAANSSPQLNSASKYKGVTWDKSRGKWLAKIKKDGVTFNLGRFHTESLAAEAYNIKAVELFGGMARTNNIK